MLADLRILPKGLDSWCWPKGSHLWERDCNYVRFLRLLSIFRLLKCFCVIRNNISNYQWALLARRGNLCNKGQISGKWTFFRLSTWSDQFINYNYNYHNFFSLHSNLMVSQIKGASPYGVDGISWKLKLNFSNSLFLIRLKLNFPGLSSVIRLNLPQS